MSKALTEQVTLTEAQAQAAAKSGRFLMQFISPGWGSSGYYSPQVLEQAVADKVIPKGTHMYADHPTATEDIDRPIRSVKDLMAVTTEDAKLSAEGAVVGEVAVVPAWQPLLATVHESIGCSIRGSATDLVPGEAEGRSGLIVEGLVAPVTSVDFVTRAGRGGKVLQVLEAARANAAAIAHGISEATVNDTREALQDVLRASYGSDARDARVWVYVRDFEEGDAANTVWFEVDGGNDPGTYAQAYTTTDGAVALTGTRTAVRQVTKYVPVTRPDSTTTTTTEGSKEDTMGKKEIEESEFTRLTEAAGRVDELTERATTAEQRAEVAEGQLAARDRRDAATEIIEAQATEAKVTFSPLEVRGLLADLPVKEGSTELDAEAFGTTVKAAVEGKTPTSTGGIVTGMGGQLADVTEGGDTPVTLATVTNLIGEAFGHAPATTQVKEA